MGRNGRSCHDFWRYKLYLEFITQDLDEEKPCNYLLQISIPNGTPSSIAGIACFGNFSSGLHRPRNGTPSSIVGIALFWQHYSRMQRFPNGTPFFLLLIAKGMLHSALGFSSISGMLRIL
jgi:hypothetical protein